MKSARLALLLALVPTVLCAEDSLPRVKSEQVAVVPLPEVPPAKFQPLYELAKPYLGRGSRLIDAQLALWLQQRSPAELKDLLLQIPTGWPGVMYSEFSEFAAEALQTHPNLKLAKDNPTATMETGRRAGLEKGVAAIEEAKTFADPKLRDAFLLGVEQNADRAESYTASRSFRFAVLAELSTEKKQEAEYRREKWSQPWPALSVLEWLKSLPADKRYNDSIEFFEQADWFFAGLAQAMPHTATLGREEPSYATVTRNAMAKVLAAREPEAAVVLVREQMKRSNFPDDFFGPLARQNLKLAQSLAEEVGDFTYPGDIAKPLARYDLVHALKWLSARERFRTDPTFAMGFIQEVQPLEPAAIVNLWNEYPGLKQAHSGSLVYQIGDWFDPRRHRAEDYANELLRLKDPEFRRSAVFSFGRRWLKHDAAAALAWGKKNLADPDRKDALSLLLRSYIVTDGAKAAKVLEEDPGIPPDLRDSLKKDFASQLAAPPAPTPTPTVQPATEHAQMYYVMIPRYSPDPKARLAALQPGGTTGEAEVKKLRAELAALSHPGQPAAVDAPLCARVLALGNDTVQALRTDFKARPPVDARENGVFRLLLERWALTAPREAADWMLREGSGFARAALPFALTRLVTIDQEKALRLLNRSPEEDELWRVREMLLAALASKNHQAACELGGREHWRFEDILKDWRRHAPEAAQKWIRENWREHLVDPY
jgi:hypothetical protein